MAVLAHGWTVVRKTKERGLYVFIGERHGEETTNFREAAVFYNYQEAVNLLGSCLPDPSHWELRAFTVTLGLS